MQDSKLFKQLSENDFEMLVDIVKPILESFKPDELVYEEGISIDTFGIVKSGKFKGEKYHYGGEVDLVQVFTPGDLIGLEIVCTPTRITPLQIISMGESELYIFRYNDLMELLPPDMHTQIQKNITQILANENMKKLYKIDMLYKKSLRERIMVFLRNMESRIGQSAFSINMDREQFAQYLGVNRSALSHELSLMQQEGIITFKKDYFKLNSPAKEE